MRRGPALIAVGGAGLFVVRLFPPFLSRAGGDPSILEVGQGIRVWGSLALGPLAALVTAVAGAWLVMARWTPRRASGLIIAAGLWMTLRGLSFVGISLSGGEGVSPAIGAYLALAGGVLVLAAGTAGGTGALLMGIGLITAFQFLGILAWATSGAVDFLAATAGVSVGIVAGVLLFVGGLLSPPERVPRPAPAAEAV